MVVPIGGKMLTTGWTGEFIHSLLTDLLRMGVPPCLSAFIGAESSRLMSGSLRDGFSAMRASVSSVLDFGTNTTDIVSFAEGLNRVL